MVQLLAQSNPNLDFTVYFQDLVNQVIGIDAVMALKVVVGWIFLVWLVFCLWVAFDAGARYKQWYVALGWFMFVLPFNFFGFIGYLFMRPAVTLDEKQWTKLESKYLMNELSSVNDCPTCGTLVPVSQNYCAVCGTQMNINCPGCEGLQSIYNAFCSSCGKQLTPVEIKKEVEKQGDTSKTSFVQKIQEAVSQARLKVANATQPLEKQKKKDSKKDSTQSGK